MKPPALCPDANCLLLDGHANSHNPRPTAAWAFFGEKDLNKINKAGYATPRGGEKGAYQNHVYRNNKVIVPYEHLGLVDLSQYEDGYVIRLFPDQYFSKMGVVREDFEAEGAPTVGVNAFVLYRSHEALAEYPPPDDWEVRSLLRDGRAVNQRGARVVDDGEYVLRLPNAGAGRPMRKAGPPQGIFAPEYAPAQINFECQAMLAWLIVHARSSPYTTTQALHLKAILEESGLLGDRLERAGITRNGLSICPLCLRVIDYAELHDPVEFQQVDGLLNAALTVDGATRSTQANLFHMEPLVYDNLNHRPTSVAWGHASCNTLLGQRHCYSLAELQEAGRKLGVIVDDDIVTIGWISEDYKMIRSPYGAVWVQLSSDMPVEEREASFDASEDRQVVSPAEGGDDDPDMELPI
ncbi:BstXI family restriction endonuclease [Streptacidiphilus cavernicola]|uniref:BstXI family restriction endonuclease n=1 Tax=Streptacidiphilus cavernicola TaxID=3342716 RepID=A0ABV6VVK1_9ACTN